MKPSTLAVTSFLLSIATDLTHISAFTPSIFSTARGSSFATTNTNDVVQCLTPNNRIHTLLHGGILSPDDQLDNDDNDDEDEDEDDDDDDEDDDDDDSPLSNRSSYSSGSRLSKTFANLKLDPDDPNPPIKPRPGRYGFRESLTDSVLLPPPIPDDQLKPTMTRDERKENLRIMRQIKKNDLADLRMRKDHAGWVDANNDLKKRERSDPWYGLNERCREAYQLGEMAEVEKIQVLMETVGGTPPGIPLNPKRGYALYTDIYDIGITPERAESAMDQQIIEERSKRGRAMIAERKKNMELEQRKWEDTMRSPGEREEKEAKERRERTMARLLGEIEEERKKKEERAKKLLGELPKAPLDSAASLDAALKAARADVKRLRKLRREGVGLGEVSDEADSTYLKPEDRIELEKASGGEGSGVSVEKQSSAARARKAAEAESSGGRPRLPGDTDIKRGEITIPSETPEDEKALSFSTTDSGPLTVQVTSSYNTEQSDPPMRKHCFQYTIRILNNSASDTVQLLSRRFEIQTVGSSMKDVVKGEGVTGRQPILAPGEVFEYTSTAPLSVRPIGTTIIAARMRGEYKYVTLKNGQEKATEEQVKKGGDNSAKLGMFHFVFPEEQRVKPIRSSNTDDYDDDDDDDDDDDEEEEVGLLGGSKMSTMASADPAKERTPAPAAVSPPSPASTLPGDSDLSTGNLTVPPNDSSDEYTAPYLRVQVTSTYRPERSDPSLDKHCFAYSVRITNTATVSSPEEGDKAAPSVQLVSRRFEIQTIGSDTKDVVQGPGVTGRQPILKPGESFEYTSTAPLSVRPMRDKTAVVARMEGEYSFVVLDGTEGEEEKPSKARMGMFHFVLPDE